MFSSTASVSIKLAEQVVLSEDQKDRKTDRQTERQTDDHTDTYLTIPRMFAVLDDSTNEAHTIDFLLYLVCGDVSRLILYLSFLPH